MVRRWSSLSSSFFLLFTPTGVPPLSNRTPLSVYDRFELVFEPPQYQKRGFRYNYRTSRARLWLRKSAKSSSASLSCLDHFKRGYSKISNSFIASFSQFVSTYHQILLPRPQLLTFFSSPSSGNVTFMNRFDLKVLRTLSPTLLFLQQVCPTSLSTNPRRLFNNSFYLEFLKFSLRSSKIKLTSLSSVSVLSLRSSFVLIKGFQSPSSNSFLRLLESGLDSEFFLKTRTRVAGLTANNSISTLQNMACLKFAPLVVFALLQPLYSLLLRLIYFKYLSTL